MMYSWQVDVATFSTVSRALESDSFHISLWATATLVGLKGGCSRDDMR